MRPRALPFAAFSVSLAACGGQPPATSDARAISDRTLLDQVAAKCGLPPSVFKLGRERELLFQAPEDPRFETIECAHGELRKTGVPFKLMFLGNGPADPERK